jgi:hypothetical protein
MQDWERIWRGSGVVFVVLTIVAFFVYGDQPKLGASPAELLSFFHGDRTRILIATVIFCLAFLELLWFWAAVSSVLRDSGMAGWGTAATASSAALGAILFLRMAVRAGLAFSIADLGHLQVTSGLADFAFALTVISCFPAAMFIMAGAFGLSRAGAISKGFFAAGVAAVVLVLLGGTTWASDGFWAPDGAYALIAQIVLFAWIAGLSGFLAMRSSASARVPEGVAASSP